MGDELARKVERVEAKVNVVFGMVLVALAVAAEGYEAAGPVAAWAMFVVQAALAVVAMVIMVPAAGRLERSKRAAKAKA